MVALTKEQVFMYRSGVLKYLWNGTTEIVVSCGDGISRTEKAHKYDSRGLYMVDEAMNCSIYYNKKKVVDGVGDILEHGPWEDALEAAYQKAEIVKQAQDIEKYWRWYIGKEDYDGGVFRVASGEGYYSLRFYAQLADGSERLVCDGRRRLFIDGPWYTAAWQIINAEIERRRLLAHPKLYSMDNNGILLSGKQVIDDVVGIIKNIGKAETERDTTYGGYDIVCYSYANYGFDLTEYGTDDIEVRYAGEVVFRSHCVRDSICDCKTFMSERDHVPYITAFKGGDWEYVLAELTIKAAELKQREMVQRTLDEIRAKENAERARLRSTFGQDCHKYIAPYVDRFFRMAKDGIWEDEKVRFDDSKGRVSVWAREPFGKGIFKTYFSRLVFVSTENFWEESKSVDWHGHMRTLIERGKVYAEQDKPTATDYIRQIRNS